MEKTFYYARVSSQDQNLVRQLKTFREMGADMDHDVFADKASGKNLDREQYQLLKKTVRDGDTLVIASLDRLGRKKADILDELRYYKDHHIRVVVLDLPFTKMDAPKENELWSDMLMNIMIEIYATLAEHERTTIRKRQREGIDAMDRDSKGRRITKDGTLYGRPETPLPENWNDVITEWKSGTITAVQAMEKTGLTKGTFYNMVKRYQIRKEA